MLVVWVLTILITWGVSLQLPKVYTAAASIYIDSKADPVMGALPGLAGPSFVATQSELIKSTRVANRVVKLLRISEVPSVFESWKEDTGGKIPIEEYFGAILLRGLVVQSSLGSNLINITYTASDPRFAASTANAFAQATLETNIELRVGPAREYAVWFDERLKVLRQNLADAQAKLSEYQKKNGIVNTDERLDQEMARLNVLNNELSLLQAQKADISSREKNSGSELSPDVMRSAVVQGIKSEIARVETKLGEMVGNIGKNHPQTIEMQALLAGLKKQLATEIQRISGGVSESSQVTSRKERELVAAIAIQKKRVLDLRGEQDQIVILRGDVETARRAYESVSARMSQSTLESYSQQTNLSVLSPAVEPTTPSRPKVLVNVGVSILVGLLLGIGAALGREFLDSRVRHRDDLIRMQGIPFLGVLETDAANRGRWAAICNWFARRFLGQRVTVQLARGS